MDALVDAVARDEEREPEHVVARPRAPLAPGRRIAVTGVRGADKTAVSALLGSVLAERRPNPVLALNAAEQSGRIPHGVIGTGINTALLHVQASGTRLSTVD